MKLVRKPENNELNNFSLGSYLFKLVPFWPLFLVLIAIGLGLAWLYLQRTTPMYETTARILIRDDKKGAEDSKASESLDFISPKRTTDNEMEVIQSKDLLESVVEDLNLYAPVYEEGQFRDEPAYNTSPIIISSNDASTLIPAKKVPFSLRDSAIYIGNSKYPLNHLIMTPYGNLIFLKNPRFIGNGDSEAQFYFSLVPLKKVVSTVADRLKVSSTNKLSTIIDLDYKDDNPQRGADIVNGIARAYNLAVVQEKNVLAANTEKFINARLSVVESNLLDIEHRQQSYQSNRGAIDIGTQGKLYLENVSNNDQKVSEINMKISVLKQVENYVQSKNLSNGIVPSTLGVEDPGLTQMVKNIYELQLEVESLKKTTGENNPLVVSYTEQIEKIKPQILENLQNQMQSLEASKNNLSSTNQTYSTQLQTMPETEKNLVDINRELNIESGIYTFLLQKKEETALSFISNEDAGKLIEKADSSDSPVSPKAKLIYGSSVFIALVLGMGIVKARESLENKIMYQQDIEKLTLLPVISEISSGLTKDPIVIGNDHQRTLIAEQFRKLRTTLSYLGIGGEKKKVMITSGISGEGKSFVALNLAISMALTGKRVVIVDFDLTNPSLHYKLNVEKGRGITDYLVGESSIASIIKTTAISKNLSFISAGNLANNPSELITSQLPGDLLDYLSDVFDFIVVDVAPLGPISDGYILSPLCDATLYVVRHAFTPKIFIERLDKNISINKLTNAAIVFNDVSSRSFGNYGYSYGYGYVYGNKNDKKRLN